MTERDRTRLEGTHPILIAAIERIFAVMAAFGHPMFVVEGVRSLERQKRLYAQGRTAPGRIVTNADGVRNPSNHQAKADGYGHAVDCAFVDDPSTAAVETWGESQPWALYGAAAQYLGLKWGGTWRTRDLPHIELPL